MDSRAWWKRWLNAVRRLVPRAPSARVRTACWAAAWVAATAALFASVTLPRQVNLRAGEVAPFTITAPHAFVDVPSTLAAQAAAAARVRPVYSLDPASAAAVMAHFDQTLQQLITARVQLVGPRSAPSRSAPAHGTRAAMAAGAPSATAVDAAVAHLQARLGLDASPADYAAVLTAPSAVFDPAVAGARSALEAMLGQGVRRSQLASSRQLLASEVSALPGGRVAALLAAAAAAVLQPDAYVNATATAAAQAAARAAVKPVFIAAGQVIVRQGDRVTAADVVRLRDAGLLNPGGSLGALLLSLLAGAGLCALAWTYLSVTQPGTRSAAEAELLLLAVPLTAGLTAVRLGAALSPFLAPIAWAALLADVAFGPGTAVFVGGVGGLGAGLLDRSLAVAVSATVAAWTAVYAIRRLQQRADLLRAGLYAAVAGAAAAGLVGLLAGQVPGITGAVLGDSTASLGRDAAAAALSGALSGTLAAGTLPFLEFLGVLTPLRLLELANPSQPLLRRLMLEAPGTYHHSLMVANLAEAACQAVGGDPLLVRVGAYYHDVGKVVRPGFFIENQMGGMNPHDALTPRDSALILQSHVRDGVDLARKARLPQAIIDFITTHHGTTIMSYFYELACRQAAAAGGAEAPEPVSPRPFRYPGPLPSTREQAIVMLADGVEAAVRAAGRPTAEEIAATIERVVAARLEDGQLDRAALTLGELATIKATFRRILGGMYHRRVEYPQALGPTSQGREGGETEDPLQRQEVLRRRAVGH